VLTRRQRRERDEPVRLAQLAAEQRVREESHWVAESAAQGRIPEFASRNAAASDAALPGWPVPLNRTGAVTDSVVRLWAGMLHNHTQSLSVLDPVDDIPARQATPVPRPASGAAGAALAAPVPVDPARTPVAHAATAAPPARERFSLGETVVLGWLRQGCGAMMEIARRVRGASWTALHTTIATYSRPRCTVTLDRDGKEVSREALARSGGVGREFELVHQVLPPGLEPGAMWLAPLTAVETAGALIESGDASPAGEVAGTGETAAVLPERGARTARMLGMRSPFEYMAINTVRRNFPKEDRAALVEGGKQVAAKLGDFLQAPCQTMSQTVAEVSNTTVGTGERVGTAACDIAYGFTPPGAILATGGQLLNLATRATQPRNVTQADARRAMDMMTFMPRPNGIVQTRGRPTLWDGRDLQKFEATEPGRGLLIDDAPARAGVERMPGVPVELGEQGWQLAEVPQAYRVMSDDDTFASDLDKIVQTSPRHGYVRIEDALYEVHRDPTTTRWRIVPPDDAQGVAIAIEHVVDERRWQTVTLLGAGDPPPLFEQYDVRDAALRGGAEGDVYDDAHGEEYNEDLLPPGVADRPVDQLMSEFVDSTRSPRELGVLHQYVEERRDEEMSVQLLTHARQMLVASEDLGRYGQGVMNYERIEIPGYAHGMSRRQLLQLGLGGNLDARQLGALVGQLIHEGLVSGVQRAADRALQGSTRIGNGVLRSDRIPLPGVPPEASYEALMGHLLYSPRFTDTQRGALVGRLHAAGSPVIHELGTMMSHIASLRQNARDNVEYEYGLDNAAAIPIEALDAEATLLGAIRTTVGMPSATLVGAAFARVEPRIRSVQNMAAEVGLLIPQVQSTQQDFAAGFENALEVELPGPSRSTSMQMALAYNDPGLVPLQRGALYKHLLDRLLMEHIEWRLNGYMGRDDAGDMTRGYDNADPESVPGLPYPFTLSDIARRLAHEETTLEQAGMLQYFAGEVADDLRVARVGAIRHRMISGAQFADYVDGYLNPPREESDLDRAIGSVAPIDNLHDLFINYASSPRRRGEIARYMARFQNEREAVEHQETVLARVFAAAQTTHRIPFAQTLIPSMLRGLVGGDCFSCSMIMSVAMRRGMASVAVFSRRLRAFEMMRTPPGGGQMAGAPVTLPLESRNVLSALASLALRQPGTSGELIAGEMVRVASGVEPHHVAGIVHSAALHDGHENHVMVTSEHAMALRVAVGDGDPRTALNFLFYEPNYGLLEFDEYDRFDHSLRIVSKAPYYRHGVFGANPRVDVYRIDVATLERVRVCGNLRVMDLVLDRPFVRARDRAQAAGAARTILGRARARAGAEAVDAGTQVDEHLTDAGTRTGTHVVHAGTQTDEGDAIEVDAARVDAGAQTDERRLGEADSARIDAGVQTDARQPPQAQAGRVPDPSNDAGGEETPEHRRRRSLDANEAAASA
jgi:hypothetical protein